MLVEDCHQYEVVVVDCVLKSMKVFVLVLDSFLVENASFLCRFFYLWSLFVGLGLHYLGFFHLGVNVWLIIFIQLRILIIEP